MSLSDVLTGSGGTGLRVMIFSTLVSCLVSPLVVVASGRAGEGSLIADASEGKLSPGPRDAEGGKNVDPELVRIG